MNDIEKIERLRTALEKLLRNQSAVEVLGEWEALEINPSMRKKAREKQGAIEDDCFLALEETKP